MVKMHQSPCIYVLMLHGPPAFFFLKRIVARHCKIKNISFETTYKTFHGTNGHLANTWRFRSNEFVYRCVARQLDGFEPLSFCKALN